jgi:hypothetical protein
MSTDFRPEELLGPPLTKDYMPSFLPSHFQIHRHRPPFSALVVREMLTDPRILFGLWLIKGPILTNAKFEIQAAGPVQQFIQANLTRFWRNSAARALKAIEWGYSGSEVLYRSLRGQIHFDVLKDLEPLDCRAATYEGDFVGMWVQHIPFITPGTTVTAPQQRLYLGGPKAFWHVHSREKHPWYGMSRLHGAHVPWWEQWSDGGYRDIRRLWFYKNSFEGGVIYHPPGVTRTVEGLIVSYRDLARELMEKKRTGGTLAFPNQMQETKRSWEYEPPTANPVPAGLLEYGELLRKEVFEGMGIPVEVIESQGEQGFGSASGRQVPQLAFFSTLQEIVQWLVTDFCKQIIDPLLEVNGFGEEVEYDVIVLPMTESTESAAPQQPGKPGQPGEKEFPPEEGEGGTPPEETPEQNPPGQPQTGGNPLFPSQQTARSQSASYEARRSQALRRRTPLRMSQRPATFQELYMRQVSRVSGTGRQESGTEKWVTIGGSPGRGAGGEQVQHKGGMRVLLSKDGKVLAGGPRALQGKHISQADEVFARLGQRQPPTPEERQAAATPAPPPKPGAPPEPPLQYQAGDLPPEENPVSAVLEDAVGSDPEDQLGFLEYLREAHDELRQEGEKQQQLSAAAEKLLGSLDRETTTTIKNRRTGIGKERKVVRRDLKYAADWPGVVRKAQKEVPQLDPQEFLATAKKLWEEEYRFQYENQQVQNQIRQKFYQQFSLTPAKVQSLMDRGYDYASKLKTTGQAVLPGFDEMARSAAHEFPEYSWTNRDDEQQIGEDVWNIVSSTREQPLSFTDKRFVAQVFQELASRGNELPDTSTMPLHHPAVVRQALSKWERDTRFFEDDEF